MAANSRGGMRPQNAGKTPSFIVIGLLVVIAILGFNYWNVSSKNSVLVKELSEMSERMRLNSVKKLSIEKRNDALLQKVRENEQELEKHKTLSERKQEEVNNLNSQLDTKKSEVDTQLQELQNVRQEYDVCNSNSQDLETKLDQATEAKSECEVKLATDKEECEKRVEAAAAASKQEVAPVDCTEQIKTSQKSLLDIIHKLWGNKAIIVLQDAGIDVSGIQLNTDGGGQLPAGGLDQKREEQQQPGQGQFPTQGQYPQDNQGFQQQGQGQYPQQQGQGQYPQETQLNQQQQGQYPVGNQQGAYPGGQQQGAAVQQGQYAKRTTLPIILSTTQPPRFVYREENNYPGAVDQNAAPTVHPALTRRVPLVPEVMNGQYQAEGNSQRRVPLVPEVINGQYQAEGNSLRQRQDQLYAPGPRYNPQDQTNQGQGQVAGEGQNLDLDRRRDEEAGAPQELAGVQQQDQQPSTWQQHQQDNQQAMGQQPGDGSPGQIGQVQAPVDRDTYNQQGEDQGAQGQEAEVGQQGMVLGDQGQLGVQPVGVAGAGGPDAPADRQQLQAPEARVVPAAPDQHQAPQGQEGALQPPPQDGAAAGADSNTANEVNNDEGLIRAGPAGDHIDVDDNQDEADYKDGRQDGDAQDGDAQDADDDDNGDAAADDGDNGEDNQFDDDQNGAVDQDRRQEDTSLRFKPINEEDVEADEDQIDGMGLHV